MRPIGDWSMSMILSICSSPSMRSCGAGPSLALLSLRAMRLVEGVDQQRRLAAAGHAGNRREQPERNFRGDVLQVVAARVDHLDGAAVVRRLALRNGDEPFAVEILPGDRRAIAHDVVGRALRDDVAAMHAGAGADVDHIVGGLDRVLVVLDHDHRVAEVAQAPQRLEQPRIVALVQADRRLVQHVQHAGQARADLRGEANALALAARQRAATSATASGSRGRRRSGRSGGRGSPSGSVSRSRSAACSASSAAPRTIRRRASPTVRRFRRCACCRP